MFVDLGPKMAKYGRWRPDTGVTRQPIAVPCSMVTMAAMYGHWLTHLRRICDIPSRRLLSAVLYGETPLGADRAEEVRLTAEFVLARVLLRQLRLRRGFFYFK